MLLMHCIVLCVQFMMCVCTGSGFGFKPDVSASVFACTLLVHLHLLDCSIQTVLARMLKELINQLWPAEILESLRAKYTDLKAFLGCSIQAVLARMLRELMIQIAACRPLWPGC